MQTTEAGDNHLTLRCFDFAQHKQAQDFQQARELQQAQDDLFCEREEKGGRKRVIKFQD